MRHLVVSFWLEIGLLAPTALVLAAVELLGAVPDVPSSAVVRLRRGLLVFAVILLVIVAIVIGARFFYLRK